MKSFRHSIKWFPTSGYAERLKPHAVCLIILSSLHPGSLMGHGGFDEEIQHSDAQIAAAPENADNWFRRAELNFLHGDLTRCLLDLEQTDRLAPGKYPVDLVRGKALLAGKKPSMAKMALDRFLSTYPNSADGLATRARLHLALGNHDQAVIDFRRALQNSRNPEPDLFLETARASIAGGHALSSLDDLEKGITALGPVPSLLFQAIEVEESLGRIDAALYRAVMMEKSAPRPEPWTAKRASILAKAGRIQESIGVWEELRDRVLNLPPPQRDSHAMRILLDQSMDAISSLKASVATAPPNVRK